MKEMAAFIFLYLSLFVPSTEDYPPANVSQMAQCMSRDMKEYFIAKCSEIPYLAVPQWEEYSWRNFDGVYNVIWRRAQLRPFPFPIDPTFGGRQLPVN